MYKYRPFPPFRPEPQLVPRSPPSRLEVIQQRLRRTYARFHILILFAAVALIVFLGIRLYDTTRPAPQRLTQRDIDAAVTRALSSIPPGPSFASQAFEVIYPSLVRVLVPGTGPNKEGAIGTGVVISEDGTILTCLHVVKDARKISVFFADGSESAAVCIAQQPENDLAVLQPDVIPDDLLPAILTNSDSLNVGDEVFAVGNPWGISNSLSAGVVSGLKRNFRASDGTVLTNMIQFDAAVNPGNSGGPLVNRNGEVVGIVSGLLNPTDKEFFIGIGFAIPIETAAAAGGAPPL